LGIIFSRAYCIECSTFLGVVPALSATRTFRPDPAPLPLFPVCRAIHLQPGDLNPSTTLIERIGDFALVEICGVERWVSLKQSAFLRINRNSAASGARELFNLT
jgi:hypothetical protein